MNKTVAQIIAEANATIREVANIRKQTEKSFERMVASEEALINNFCSQLSEMANESK